jgi:HTH-type transcriptional regulator/antitoxin HigA
MGTERSFAEVWHPGVYLAEEMRARGWTAADAARAMGELDHQSLIINELAVMAICGEILMPDDEDCRIGPEEAANLAKAFGTSPEFWLNLDAIYASSGHIRHRYG